MLHPYDTRGFIAELVLASIPSMVGVHETSHLTRGSTQIFAINGAESRVVAGVENIPLGSAA